MSEVKTLVNVYRAAYSNDKGTHREALVAGIAAVCRAVMAEREQAAPAEAKQVDVAGDWADVTWTEARRLFTSTMKMNDSECAAIIREAANRHYGKQVDMLKAVISAGKESSRVEHAKRLANQLDAMEKERDELKKDVERMQQRLVAGESARHKLKTELDDAKATRDLAMKLDRAWFLRYCGFSDEYRKARDNTEVATAARRFIKEVESIEDSGVKVLDDLTQRAEAAEAERDKSAEEVRRLKCEEEINDGVIRDIGRIVGCQSNVDGKTLNERVAEIVAERDRLKSNIAAGVAEMRRYVEGNGFEWQPELSSVDNVTTAIGWLGGAVVTMKADRDKLAEELAIAVSAIAWADTHYCHVAANNRGVLAAYRATKGKEQGDGNA